MAKKRRKEGGEQAEYFSASPKERGRKRRKQAELFRKNVRQTSGIFLVQARKKGRRREREKRKAQIENKDEQKGT